MAQLPDSIRAFRDHVRSMSLEDLQQHPNHIDPAANIDLVKHPLLSASLKFNQSVQDSYPLVQSGFFHFAGHCEVHCGVDHQHVHSIQAKGVLQVKGFPGFCIYPQMFVPVLPEMLDEVMELRETDEAKEMDYVLHIANEGPRCTQVVPPDRLSGVIRTAFTSYFRVHNAENATLSISTAQHMTGMRQPNSSRGIIAHVSFGCDAVIVLGTEKTEVDVDAETGAADRSPPSKSPLALAAIHLRAGDALIFGNLGCATWYGLAKVLDSSSQLDHQWPYLREDTRDSGIRGQLNGKTVEIEFQ